MGFADKDGCFYIHTADLTPDVRDYILDFLTKVQLTNFNVLFDGTFLLAQTGQWLNWIGCSYWMFKALSTEGYDSQKWDLETFQRDVLGWTTSNKEVLEKVLKERGLTKATMWQLEPEILGVYAAGDADSAYQGWEVVQQVCQEQEHDLLMQFHQREVMTLVELLAEQHIRGIEIDIGRLTSYHSDLGQRIALSKEAFLSHPEVSPHIAQYNGDVLASHMASQPPRLTKKNEITSRWTKWNDKIETLKNTNHFNINSKQSLEWLFYDRLGHKAMKITETGRQSVDKKVLPFLGEPGRMLNGYNLMLKEMGYVESVMEKTAEDSAIHPQFNIAGTVTLRLAGSGGLNIQQMPKSKGFLSAWKARAGYKLVQLDIAALEPTVLAEFSKDRSLLNLYGRDAIGNDIYLWVAAQIPALGKEIRKYYDPFNPTPESIAAAKKACKRDRQIAKVVVLSAAYNAGPRKIHETLVMSGIDISFEEVCEIHRGYWRLFAGVKEFEQQLLEMWHTQGGYIIDALGCPIAIADKYTKDIVNRFCQTSGHRVLSNFIYQIAALRRERNVELYPWITNIHDESIWEVREDHAEQALELFREALRRTNEELDMGVLIKGEPMLANTLADIKVED